MDIIIKNAATNIHAQVFVWTCFQFSYICKSGIAGSYGKSMLNILRNCQTLFHGGCTSFSFPSAIYWGIKCFHILNNTWVYLAFLILIILLSVKWHFTGVFTCIYLMTNDVERLFICLLTICISFSKKCLFRSLIHLLTGVFIFLLLSCNNFLMYSGYSTLVRYMLCKYFSRSVSWLFTFLMASLKHKSF